MKESENQQVVEECVKQEICEQVCVNCKLRDIEDCVVSTDTTAIEQDDTEVNEIYKENSEKLVESENEEKVLKEIDENEISSTINEVGA